MKWFYDLKVGTKLLASFVLVAAIAGAIGWVGLSATGEMKTRADSTYADRLVPIRDLGYANAALLIARTETRNILLEKQLAGRQKYADLIDVQDKKVDGYIAGYSKRVLVKEEQETLPKFQAAWAQY